MRVGAECEIRSKLSSTLVRLHAELFRVCTREQPHSRPKSPLSVVRGNERRAQSTLRRQCEWPIDDGNVQAAKRGTFGEGAPRCMGLAIGWSETSATGTRLRMAWHCTRRKIQGETHTNAMGARLVRLRCWRRWDVCKCQSRQRCSASGSVSPLSTQVARRQHTRHGEGKWCASGALAAAQSAGTGETVEHALD